MYREFDVRWKILQQHTTFNPTNNSCRLCLSEKFTIMFQPEMATLNQRDEFYTPCMHKQNKLLDKTWFWNFHFCMETDMTCTVDTLVNHHLFNWGLWQHMKQVVLNFWSSWFDFNPDTIEINFFGTIDLFDKKGLSCILLAFIFACFSIFFTLSRSFFYILIHPSFTWAAKNISAVFRSICSDWEGLNILYPPRA